jgi:hypothetical protein
MDMAIMAGDPLNPSDNDATPSPTGENSDVATDPGFKELPSHIGGGDTELQRLIATYVPPKNYLRTLKKSRIKRIYSLIQGRDGVTAFCCICGNLGDCKNMHVHHKNHMITDNRLDNLGLAHPKCNDDDNAKYRARRRNGSSCYRMSDLTGRESAGLGDKASIVPTHREASLEEVLDGIPASSLESAKHRIMRSNFTRWLRDLVNGPFARRASWNIRLLAETAVYGCSPVYGQPFGSSKTYLKYSKEEVAAGVLLRDENETGVFGYSVRLNFDLLKKYQDQSGT